MKGDSQEKGKTHDQSYDDNIDKVFSHMPLLLHIELQNIKKGIIQHIGRTLPGDFKAAIRPIIGRGL